MLQIATLNPHSPVGEPATALARLRYLLTVAFIFGGGATLTGATFLANDKTNSKTGDRDR